MTQEQVDEMADLDYEVSALRRSLKRAEALLKDQRARCDHTEPDGGTAYTCDWNDKHAWCQICLKGRVGR